jgi:signal transduction histidine kinase
MARRTLFITYFTTYIIAISNSIRAIVDYYDCDCDALKIIALLIVVYLVLLFAEPLLIRQNRIRAYIYMIAQIATILALAFNMPGEDFWTLMILPLVVQAMVNFEPRTGYIFTGILIAIMPYYLLSSLGPAKGLPLMFIYGSAYVLLAAFIVIVREVIAARDESRKQKAELQVAHQQLLAYTKQAEELAVLEERNRLARELHDAVTQTLFSASLIAEALPALWERDQEMGRERLAMLRQMSRGALAEMRTLLLELRPAALVETGLEDLLRQLGEAVTGREGVPVTVEVDGLCELPADLHVALYRIAQEALNNVVKHAKASQVAVSLRCTPRVPSPSSREGEGTAVEVELCIRDDGRGFDPDEAPSEHMGLGIMRERAEAVGAQLGIVSQTGRGTQVTMVWPGDEGQQNNRSSSVC